MKILIKTFHYLTQYRKYLIALVILNIVIATVSILPPFIYKQFIDIITLGPTDQQNAIRVFGYIGLYIVVQVTENWLTSLDWYLSVLWRRTIRDNLNLHVTARAFQLEQGYYHDKTVGEILQKINTGIDEATSMYLFYPRELIEPLAKSIISFTLISAIDLRVGVLLGLLAPPYIYLHQKKIATNKKYLPLRRDKEEKAAGAVTEVLNSLESTKVNSNPEHVLQKAKRLLNDAFTFQKEQYKRQNLYSFASEFILNLAIATALTFTAYNIYYGSMTLGDLVLVTMLSGNLLRPISRILQQQMRLQETIIGLERFYEVLDAPREARHFSGTFKPSSVPGKVSVKRLTFGYDPRRPILKNISFDAEPGQNIALIGPSGSGKTTFTKLLCGLYVPTKGSILIDDVSITQYDLAHLRSHIAVVFQEPFIFSDTIKNNLKFVRPNATNKQIESVITLANLNEFIDQLPKGIHTQVGERGVKLSGGQKQRLAIAQAFLKDAPIIIFDEATSSLDAENERLIQDAMTRLMQNRTTFIISHRLATVRHADQIIVLHHGRIKEHGSHSELIKAGGIYQQFYSMQISDPEKRRELDLV